MPLTGDGTPVLNLSSLRKGRPKPSAPDSETRSPSPAPPQTRRTQFAAPRQSSPPHVPAVPISQQNVFNYALPPPNDAIPSFAFVPKRRGTPTLPRNPKKAPTPHVAQTSALVSKPLFRPAGASGGPRPFSRNLIRQQFQAPPSLEQSQTERHDTEEPNPNAHHTWQGNIQDRDSSEIGDEYRGGDVEETHKALHDGGDGMVGGSDDTPYQGSTGFDENYEAEGLAPGMKRHREEDEQFEDDAGNFITASDSTKRLRLDSRNVSTISETQRHRLTLSYRGSGIRLPVLFSLGPGVDLYLPSVLAHHALPLYTNSMTTSPNRPTESTT